MLLGTKQKVRNDMGKIIKVIGSFVVALLTVSIPFTCALSFAYKWDAHSQFLLMVFTFALVVIIMLWIYTESEEE